MEENQVPTSPESPNKARSVFQKILDDKLAELRKKLEKKHQKEKKRTDATITFLKAEIEKAKKKVNDPELLRQKLRTNGKHLSAAAQPDAAIAPLKRALQHQITKTRLISQSKAFTKLFRHSILSKLSQQPKHSNQLQSQISSQSLNPPLSQHTAIPQIGGSAIPPLPSGGSAIPQIGGSAIPTIPLTGSSIPAVGSSAIPAVGSSAIPVVGGSAIPAIGGSAIPAMGGSAIPTPAFGGSAIPSIPGSAIPLPQGSAIPAFGGSAIPSMPPLPPGGSAIPGIGSAIPILPPPGGMVAPPPPPGIGGLVPPPPPGVGGLMPPPPPLLGMGGGSNSAGAMRNIFEKEMKPSEGLVPKRLQWIVVSQNQVKDTFWLHALTKAKVDLDYKELEKLFCGQQESPVKKPEKQKEEESTPRKPKQMILDAKKIQDTAIQLKNFNYSTEETKEIFQSFDTEKMTNDFVEKLKRVIPGPEEAEKLKIFKGKAQNLQKEEQFLLMLTKIPRNKQILRCLEQRQNFSFLEESSRKDISLMIKAGEALLENKNLEHILIIVLKIGNFLNHGTNKGRAIGFKLDFLTKIFDIQSASKIHKMSLFLFIVKTVRGKNRQLLNFIQELAILQVARNIDISIAEDKIKEIQKLLGFIKKEIDFQSALDQKSNLNQRFLEEFGSFYAKSESALHSLQEKWDKMKKLETQLNKRFGERNDSTLQQMLQKIGEFTKRFESSLVEMVQREEREERDKIKKQARNPKLRRQTSMAPAISRSLRFCVGVKSARDDIQMRGKNENITDSSSDESDNNETGTSLKTTKLLLTKLSLRNTPQDARFKKKISQPAHYKT